MKSRALKDLNIFRDTLINAGACEVAVGDLTGLPEDQRQGMPTGISIAVALDLALVNALGTGMTSAYYAEYNRANILLDNLALLAEDLLRQMGFSAIPLTRSQVKRSFRDHGTILPHKTVATRAGLGWIGKNALLVTKERGSAVRITSVLTDADFPLAEPCNVSQCGDCDLCVRNCPGKAPLGPHWSMDAKREDFFDVHSCRKSCIETTWRIAPGLSMCSFCVLVCPWTKRAIENAGLDYGFPAAQIAQKGDLEEILALQKSAFYATAQQCNDYSIPPLSQTLEGITDEFFARERATIFLKIVMDRRIVGSARAYEADGTCYIGRVIVHPDYQRQGLGQRLMKAMESCYRGARFELFTGEENIENIRFYESLGYRIFDTQSVTDTLRLVYMEKN